MDTDEARKLANSINIEEDDELLEHLDDEQLGQVYCWPRPGGFEFRAVRKPGLDPDRQQHFDEWAHQRAFILALQGDPEHIDGWYRRQSDHGWQITCREIWGGPGPAPN